MEFIWYLLIVLCSISVLLIISIILPLPFSVRAKMFGHLQKLKFPIVAVMGFLITLFAQEFVDQKKHRQRREMAENAPNGATTLLYSSTEIFKHQRNMYLDLLTIVLLVIVLILITVIPKFIKEHEFLEQHTASEIARQAAPAKQSSAPAQNPSEK